MYNMRGYIKYNAKLKYCRVSITRTSTTRMSPSFERFPLPPGYSSYGDSTVLHPLEKCTNFKFKVQTKILRLQYWVVSCKIEFSLI